MANGNHLNLPADVDRQLAIFRRTLWLAETLAAVFGAVAGIFGAYLVLFVSDRLWDTPGWLRTLLTIGCVGFVGWWLWFWVERWGVRQRDSRQLAKMVQRHFPRLGDRLLGIVELAHPDTRPPGVSEKLCEAAMQQVAAETTNLDFAQAVSKRQQRRWTFIFAGLAAVAVVALAVLPLAGLNAWHRLLNPFGNARRYTLAKLEGLPDKQIVPYGEPFTLKAGLAPNSEWFPARAVGRYQKQPPLDVPAIDHAFTFKVPGQTTPGTFALKAGDARDEIQIAPMHRPELLQLQAIVELPEYLGYGTVTQDVRRGTADLLAGSQFTLAGTASRELSRITAGSFTGKVVGTRFELANADAPLFWEDRCGLSAKEPFKLKLNTVEDQPPGVDCRGIQRVVAMLDDEVLEFEVAADDDYGVRDIGLTWSGTGMESANVPPAKGESVVARGSQPQRSLAGKVLFSPKQLRIGPQRLELHATATDFKPGRVPAESNPYYILILDKTEHAKLVQREFDRLVEKLEELQRAEEALHERNSQLQRELENSRNPAEHAEKLAEQEQAERRNAAELQKLQEALAKLAKEALRNSQINEEVVAQWAQLAQMLAKLSQSEMAKVMQALARAQMSKTGGEQQGNMREAMEQQAEVLKQLAEALKQMNQSGEMMQAGNFVGRLRKMATLEKTVGDDMSKLFPQTVGATVDQLTGAIRIKVQRLGDQHSQVHQGVRTIRDEMGGFVTRTQQERYRNVYKEMVSTKVVEDLERLTALLDKKVSQEGIEGATKWSTQLTDWANRLQPKSEGGGSGNSGGGNCQAKPEVIAALMKLARIRQGEEDLRSHTRALETRRQMPDYAQRAEELSDRQGMLRSETTEAGEVLKGDPEVGQLLALVDRAMKDAGMILARPQTDLEANAAETEVIELLSDLLDKASQKQGSAAQGLMAMLRALQQGNGNGTGKTPGGNNAGGVTERDNVPVNGDPAGNAAEHRNVNKGGGPDLSKIPAEFREAMQAYFEKVEKP